MPEFNIETAKELCNELKISEVLSMLLLRRGIKNSSDARWYLNDDALYLYDPMLLMDMDKAIERVDKAIKNNEKICIYGDYDVDGITSTAVLYKYLKSKLCDYVSYYIPDRLTEGYGMNKEAIKRIAEDGTHLLITVDNGICANEEISFAKELGMDVVVTDHHECRTDIPCCCAVVNPMREDDTYPFKNLAGVGVAFKLICALEKENLSDDFYNKYLDLVSLGTISDVMPLCDENRQIVARGLSLLENGTSPGVDAILDVALYEKNKNRDKHISASTIGYMVAPRLNAAGRIGNVTRAVEILTEREYSKCLSIAEELCEKNRERQHIENKIFEEAVEIIERKHDFTNDKIIVVCKESWHHGVVGIVASRITEKYGLPSILICSENGIGKGSARSVKGVNINEAIHACSGLLLKHGGHELAAGLSLEIQKVNDFRSAINCYVRDKINEETLEGCVEIDAELAAEDINLRVCEEIASLEPFGAANPVPSLYMRDVKVESIISLGQNRHTKLILKKNDIEFEGLYFGFCPDDMIISKSGIIDILFNLDINEFRGERNPQAIIKDIRLSQMDAKSCAHQLNIYYDMLEGAHPDFAPSIELCRKVYSYIRSNEKRFSEKFNAYVFAEHISAKCGILLSLPVFRVIIDIFCEMGLARLIFDDGEIMRLELMQMNKKVNLDDSEILKKVRSK